MSQTSNQHSVLVVDDDPGIRETTGMLLAAGGYQTRTAQNGFDALLQIEKKMPDVIISDLNMPAMSGFELLAIVRRRFPEMPVIAISGDYECDDCAPGGAIADAFYAKGRHQPQALLQTVAFLIRNMAARTNSQQPTP